MKGYYRENSGIALCGVGTIFVCIFLANSKLHFNIGPCTKLQDCPKIMDRKVDTWLLWSAVMTIVIMKEAIMAYALTTYRPWYYNQVMDHKAERVSDKSILQVLGMVSIWKTFVLVSELLDLIIVISGDLQFIVVQLIIEIIVSCINTFITMKRKNGDERVNTEREENDGIELISSMV